MWKYNCESSGHVVNDLWVKWQHFDLTTEKYHKISPCASKALFKMANIFLRCLLYLVALTLNSFSLAIWPWFCQICPCKSFQFYGIWKEIFVNIMQNIKVIWQKWWYLLSKGPHSNFKIPHSNQCSSYSPIIMEQIYITISQWQDTTNMAGPELSRPILGYVCHWCKYANIKNDKTRPVSA